MRYLNDIRVGETAVVIKILGEGALRRRLLDMGITKGVKVLVRKLAPLGDPMQIHVRGYELSLRQSEAERIVVEE